MALVSCPRCGRAVSDKSKFCIHCGAELKITPPAANYEELPLLKQEALLKEFLHSHPAHDYGEAGHRRCDRLTWGSLLIWLLGWIVMLMWVIAPKGDDMTVQQQAIMALDFSLFVLLNLMTIIGFGVGMAVSGKYLRKALLGEKLFQTWLKQKKGIVYMPKFASDKVKKMYDAIPTENYKL